MKNWNIFQDQTFTAKLITPPKSMYKLVLNGLCHMSGQFYEGRSGKFRHVRDFLVKSRVFWHVLVKPKGIDSKI